LRWLSPSVDFCKRRSFAALRTFLGALPGEAPFEPMIEADIVTGGPAALSQAVRPICDDRVSGLWASSSFA
jgi:hypothetical protein